MTIALQSTAAMALFLAAGCSTVQVVNSTLDIPPNSSVELVDVEFQHDKYEKQEEVWLAVMRKQEDVWRKHVQDAFAARALEHGIDKGTADTVEMRVRITDIEPGSQVARYFAGGFGAGHGYLEATVDAGTYGSIEAKGEITGGWLGGDIATVFADLGRAAADTAHEVMTANEEAKNDG